MTNSTSVYLVTGAAGFIGFHLAKRLLEAGCTVIALDNMNAYYDVRLKEARLARLRTFPEFRFEQGNLEDAGFLARLFTRFQPTKVLHLAAQPGVRYSIDHPETYGQSNLVGFLNILEACRHNAIEHLVYASSSSVYGNNPKTPFATTDNVDHPISLYAATKKCNELMAHSYSHLYRLPTTGLRFFTVYGPWGRPDMAVYKFVQAVIAGETIDVYNHGDMQRDFTFIDDIADGILKALVKPPIVKEGEAPYRIYNIGNNRPTELLHLIALIEQATGNKAKTRLLPMQPGDVETTFADIEATTRDFGFVPKTPIEVGIPAFVRWYREFHGI